MGVPDGHQLEILLKAFEHAMTNQQRLVDRNQTLATWIASLLIAIIGFVSTFASGKFGGPYSLVRLGLIATVVCLFLFVWIAELLTFRARVAESQAGARIAKLLHFF